MKFNKASFTYDQGGYLYYEGNFIARFKYRGPVTMPKFRAVLTKYYTVEGYLARLNTPASSPLGILREDGHLKFENNQMILDGRVLR